MAGFPVGRTVAAQLKAQLRPSQRPGTGFCYFGWRSKYLQLCLFPTHGFRCRGKHPANRWAWVSFLEVPPTPPVTPSPGRVQADGSCSTAHPMCVWINRGANGEDSWANFYHIFFLPESSRCHLQSRATCICVHRDVGLDGPEFCPYLGGPKVRFGLALAKHHWPVEPVLRSAWASCGLSPVHL